jgi:putative Holliday junction resolvase
MRVLGIDVGLKRTGLAVSDALGISVRMLPNLQANSQKAALEKIISLINELSVEAVVIGRPQANTVGSKAIFKRAEGLKLALEMQVVSLGLNTRIYLWDETQTSKKAMSNLVNAEVPLKKRRNLLDAASAAVIVEDFLFSAAKNSADAS